MIAKIVWTSILVGLWAASAFPQNPPVDGRNSAKVEGVVQDAKGNGLAAIPVVLGGKDRPANLTTTTDRNGKFALSVAQPGIYRVGVGKGESLSVAPETLTLTLARKRTITVVVDPSGSAHIASDSGRASAQEAVQFADNPNFVVAGVTDSTDAGGHGSQVRVRTSETLAQDTAALKSSDRPEDSTRRDPVSTGEQAKLYDLARLDTATGNYSRARTELQSLISKSDKAEWHRLLADVDEHLNDSLDAVHEYEQAVRLDPSEENYFDWGSDLLVHRAIAPAIEVFTKGAQAHPSSARMRAGLGAALYASGSPEDAARKVCEASDLQPGNSRHYILLGKIVASSASALPCAEDALQGFVHSQPDNPEANYYYALALWKRVRDSASSQDSKQIEDLLRKAVALNPQFAEAYLQLGLVAFSRGDLNQATEAYTKAIQANSNLAEAHYRLGLAYKRMGQESKAENEFAAYKTLDQAESAENERQRKAIQQFVIVFKDNNPVAAQ